MTDISSAAATSFSGIWPALLTPLDAELGIAHGRFASHAGALLAAGCGGVTPFGTTGEGPSFSVDERRAAVEALVAGGVPAGRILVSTSCAALPETLALTRHALKLGTHGCLMLPPFFLKGVSDQGVIDSYRYVIDGAADERLKLYLYHIPQVTGVGLSHHAIDTLKRIYPDTIVGIKDSSCELSHSLGLVDAFMPELTVYVGNELDLPELGRRGSPGAVSGLANFMPRRVRRLVTEFDAPGTAADRDQVARLLDLLGAYALTPALKGVMAMLSGDTGWLRVRPPLVALSAEAFGTLQRELRAIGIHTDTD